MNSSLKRILLGSSNMTKSLFASKFFIKKFRKIYIQSSPPVIEDLASLYWQDLESFKHELQVSDDVITKVAIDTVKQNDSTMWSIIRKHRLTASNFGDIIIAIKRNSYPPSLFSKLSGYRDISYVKAIMWGNSHEKTAIELYEKVSGNKVVKTGLHLINDGYIGCSPDGLIGDDGIIEVKCPFKYKYCAIADIISLNDKAFCLSDDYTLKENHPYYHQVQGALHITNRRWCDFIVWTEKCSEYDFVYVRIHKKDIWSIHFDSIKQFYFQNYLPHVFGQKELEI